MWIPDPGETHQAKLGEAGTGFSHPKIQNPESAPESGKVKRAGEYEFKWAPLAEDQHDRPGEVWREVQL